MQSQTDPESGKQPAQRAHFRRLARDLLIFGIPRPWQVAWLSASVVALVVGYELGFRITLGAVREATSMAETAQAELPQNSILWDQPEWAPIRERQLREMRRAASFEPLLQFWLPALLSLGLGAAIAMAMTISAPIRSDRTASARLRATKIGYRQAGLLGALALVMIAIAASEFLARWRPHDFPPSWSTWLNSLTAPMSLWLRAGLPLCLGSVLALLGVRVAVRAMEQEDALCDPPPRVLSAHAVIAVPTSTPVRRPRRRRIAARTSRFRLQGLLLIATTGALCLTAGLREFRGHVPDGRFDSETLRYFDRELGPRTSVRTDIILLGQIPLFFGLCLVIAAPRLAALPWQRRRRAVAGRCQRCGVFLEACAEHCWDCGEVVRCTKCDHALRADQDQCPECGSGRGGRGTA